MAELKQIRIWKGEDGYLCQNKETGEIVQLSGASIRFPVYPGQLGGKTDILELNLQTRPMNCLRRVGINTIEELVNRINGIGDLKKIRHMGEKSAENVMEQLLQYQYDLLKPERREHFHRRILELNRIHFTDGEKSASIGGNARN